LPDGAGFAGAYMPGLKALTEAVPEKAQGRAVAFYTASFTVGNGVSFFATGELAALFGWRPAFALLALGPMLAAALALVLLPPRPPASAPLGRLFDFRPIFKNRRALGHMVAYLTHNAESSVMRAWAVAFLAFAQAHATAGAIGAAWSPTTVAAIANFLGFPAIVAVGEMTRRFPRRAVLVAVMVGSGALGVVLGLSAAHGIALALAVGVVYAALVPADAGTINAGLVATTVPERRGQAMALHALFGFTGAFIGPVVFGVALDVATVNAWANPWPLAFAVMAGIAALGALALAVLDR